MVKGHGDDIYDFGTAVRLNFSSNILSGVDHSGLMQAMSSAQSVVANYPEAAPCSLERRIADRLGISPDEVMVTAGATDAIYLVARSYIRGRSVILGPTFSEYADACVMHGHSVTRIRNLSDMDLVGKNVWMCNPNNPTGTVIDHEEFLNVAHLEFLTTFIIDEAYADYTQKSLMTAGEAVECGNVLLLRSLTKRFSVPGLRIGYIVAGSRRIERLREYRMPWVVSGPALAGAHYLLDHEEDYVIDSRALHCEALRVAEELRGLGIEVSQTDCNFMLCRLPDGMSASELKLWLVKEHGMLIRDASNFTGLTTAHFRIAVQGKDADNQLIKAIGEWLSL